MTECERIISKGIIPASFLEPETRNDFYVDENRKKIWMIELDLLLELDRICKKHGLKYSLDYGTLLGAVRHKGFIPWDDDVDVSMPRKDYNTLLTLFDEFENPYFLQTPHTCPQYAYSFARLVNDNTTFCSKMFLYQGFHAGVFLDIFPIDNWKLEEGREAYARIHQLALENSTYMRLTNPNLDEKNKERVANWCGMHPVKVFDEINEIASQYQDEDTPYYAQPVCPLDGYEKHVLPIHLLADSMLIDFEGFTFPVPVAYHEILTVSYGDYMQFPPVEQRGLWHSDMIILPDVPYAVALEDYIKRNE